MDIFADNVVFTDNISPRLGHQTNTVQGHEGYSRQMWSLRFHAALLFSRSHVSSSSLILMLVPFAQTVFCVTVTHACIAFQVPL